MPSGAGARIVCGDKGWSEAFQGGGVDCGLSWCTNLATRRL